MEKHRCSESVMDGYRLRPCSRNGKYCQDGKWWCRAHLPSVIDERAAESQRKWEADMAKRQHDHDSIAACADIPNPAAIPGAVEALLSIKNARDYRAETGNIHPDITARYECFDDWAADTADQALRDMGVEA